MKVKDLNLLAEFRSKRQCENCGRVLCRLAEPHHLKPKGHGGGSRLDVRENLIALGGPWDCACHVKAENAEVSRASLLTKIAAREGKTPEECRQVVDDLLAKPKENR